MRVRLSILITPCVAALIMSCGYGKDTGPKRPKTSPQFAPLADRFAKRCDQCFEDVFHANMGRQMSAKERADTAKKQKAMGEIRREIFQCMSGKGYGNEVQLDPSVAEVWLAKTGCPQFAAAAFKAPQCIALQSVLEEVGFDPSAPAPATKPPAKKRPPAAK